MGLFTNPLGHAGFPPATTGSTATVDTPYTQTSAVRAATLAEVEAGVINYAYVSPATFSGGSTADFASPPPIGSTAPNTIVGTTVRSTGLLTGGTGITATTGAITATNGNLVLGTAGNKIVSTSVGSSATAGANSFGTVALVAGTVTVATTAVTASSIIMLTRLVAAGTSGTGAIGMLSVGTITAGTSFVINALTTADLATVVTNDISTIGWMIIN